MAIIGEAFVRIRPIDEITPAVQKQGAEIEKNVGGKAEKASGRFRTAMGSITKSLGSSFSPALGPIQEVFEKVEGIGEAAGEMRSKTGKSFIALGGAATAAGVLLQGMGDKDKIAMGQLKTAIENTGGSWEKYKDETEETVKTEEKYGHTAAETQSALNVLVTRTGKVKESYESMSLVTNLAANRHMSLSSAAGIVARVMNGNTRVLRQYGISTAELNKLTDTGAKKAKEDAMAKLIQQDATTKAAISTLKERDASIKAQLATTTSKKERKLLRDELVKDRLEHTKLADSLSKNKDKEKDLHTAIKGSTDATKNGAAAIDLLSKKMKGQADIAADTFTGKMKEARAKVDDFVASWGSKLGPAITASGPALLGIGAIIEAGPIDKFKKLAGGIGKIPGGIGKIQKAVKEWTVVQWLLDAATSPMLLIPLAIAAIVAAFVIAYIKIKPFHELVNKIAHDMKKWFIDAFDAVKKAFKTFVSDFESVWKTVVDIVKKYGLIVVALFAPMIGIPLLIIVHWKQITAFFSKLVADVEKILGSLVHSVSNFFTTMWHNARQIASNLINDVVNFFKSLPGRISSGLSSLAGTVGSAIARGFSNISGVVKRAFGGAASWVLNAGRNAINGFINGARQMFGSIGRTLAGAKRWVTDAFGNAGGWLLGIGHSIVQGLINGIKNLAGGVGGALKDAISGIPAGVKKFFHISSPSRLMMDLGGNISEGMAIGIASKTHMVKNAADKLTRLAVPTTTHAGANIGIVGSGGQISSSRVINLFPNAVIDFGNQDPAAVVKRLERAVLASRL